MLKYCGTHFNSQDVYKCKYIDFTFNTHLLGRGMLRTFGQNLSLDISLLIFQSVVIG